MEKLFVKRNDREVMQLMMLFAGVILGIAWGMIITIFLADKNGLLLKLICTP